MLFWNLHYLQIWRVNQVPVNKAFERHLPLQQLNLQVISARSLNLSWNRQTSVRGQIGVSTIHLHSCYSTRGLEVINKRSMWVGSERNVTNDVQVVDQTHLRLTGHLTFVLAVVGASGAAQMKRPRVRIGRMQHLESTVTDERVRIHRQEVTVSLADPRHLASDTKGGKSMRKFFNSSSACPFDPFE
jgi:hypothetical protein